MCAKYDRSRMNDAHTVCPADFVGLPTKVVWPTAFFFEKESDFCMAFVSAVSRLSWESARELYLILQHLD